MVEKPNDESKAVATDGAKDTGDAKPVEDGSAAVTPRRQLGVKEPIIFKWKLLGSAGDLMLTLFKSTEREDVDAQFERVQREGYYKDLKIVEADAKVPQSKKVKDTLAQERKQMGSAAEKKAREDKKPQSRKPLAAPKQIRIGRTKAAKARAIAAAAEKAAKKAAKKPRAKKAPKKAVKTPEKKVVKKSTAAKKVKKSPTKKTKAARATKKKPASSPKKRRKR
jgi:hypothetical protein